MLLLYNCHFKKIDKTVKKDDVKKIIFMIFMIENAFSGGLERFEITLAEIFLSYTSLS